MTRSRSAPDAQRLNKRRKKTGVVTSDKMQKTIVVRVSHKFLDPGLGKVLEQFVKFKAHDEKNEAKTGDTVEIEEARPLSREKRWRLLRVVKKAGEAAPEVTLS